MIDGRNTFHGMGMIATITPGTKRSYQIPRLTVSTDEICSIGHVKVKYFTSVAEGFRSLSYQPLPALNIEDPTSAIDVFWNTST